MTEPFADSCRRACRIVPASERLILSLEAEFRASTTQQILASLRSFRSLAWQWPEGRYIAAAYFLPLAYAAVAYGAVWALRLGGWNSDLVVLVSQRFGLHGMPPWGAFTLWLLFTATTGLIRGISTALGEEIGWRGFLGPEFGEADVLHQAKPAQRRHLGGMA